MNLLRNIALLICEKKPAQRAGQKFIRNLIFDSSTSFDDSYRILHSIPRIIICRYYVLRRFPLLPMLHCSATSHKLLMNRATSISLNIYFIISFTSCSVNLCKLFFQGNLIQFICTFFHSVWHLSACTDNHHIVWHDCCQLQEFFL